MNAEVAAEDKVLATIRKTTLLLIHEIFSQMFSKKKISPTKFKHYMVSPTAQPRSQGGKQPCKFCKFHCQKGGSANQISEHHHMAIVHRMLKHRSHTLSIAIANLVSRSIALA